MGLATDLNKVSQKLKYSELGLAGLLPLIEDVCQRAADVRSHLVVGGRGHGGHRGR